MENYISTVLNKIKDGKVKAEIQAELEDHYNERVEYYTRIGYDQETAETKANEHFGKDAVIVGEQLDSINRKNLRTNIIFTVVNVLFFARMFTFLFAGVIFDTLYAYTEVGSNFVFLFTLLALIELFVALRNKSSYLAGLGVAGTAFFALLFMGYSPVIFCWYKLFKGEAGKFVDLIKYDWKSANTAVNVACVLFYLFCIGLFIYAVILAVKFRQCKYKKRHINREKWLKLIAVSTFVLALPSIILSFIAFKCPLNEISGFYIVESDEMIDPSKIENYKNNYLGVGWDLGRDYIDTYNKNNALVNMDSSKGYMNIFNDDTDVVYDTLIVYGEFQPTKKYVCMIPANNYDREYIVYFDDCEWIDTSKEYLFISDFYWDPSALVQYKIKILPRENVVGD